MEDQNELPLDVVEDDDDDDDDVHEEENEIFEQIAAIEAAVAIQQPPPPAPALLAIPLENVGNPIINVAIHNDDKEIDGGDVWLSGLRHVTEYDCAADVSFWSSRLCWNAWSIIHLNHQLTECDVREYPFTIPVSNAYLNAPLTNPEWKNLSEGVMAFRNHPSLTALHLPAVISAVRVEWVLIVADIVKSLSKQLVRFSLSQKPSLASDLKRDSDMRRDFTSISVLSKLIGNLCECRLLRHLKLLDVGIMSDEKMSFRHTLRPLTSLESFAFTHASIRLSDNLFQSIPSAVAELDLSGNMLASDDPDAEENLADDGCVRGLTARRRSTLYHRIDYMVPLTINTKSLGKLNLSSSKLDDWTLLQLVSGLPTHSHLVYLDLSDNNSVTTSGWSGLLYALSSTSPQLSHLRLTDIHFSAKIAAPFSFLISTHSALETLNLHMNITEKMSKKDYPITGWMLPVLKTLHDHTCTLKNLTCSLNVFDGQVCGTVCDMLTKNKTLVQLTCYKAFIDKAIDEDEHDYFMSNQSTCALINMLQVNTTLQVIGARYPVQFRQTFELSKTIENHGNLLHFFGCPKTCCEMTNVSGPVSFTLVKNRTRKRRWMIIALMISFERANFGHSIKDLLPCIWKLTHDPLVDSEETPNNLPQQWKQYPQLFINNCIAPKILAFNTPFIAQPTTPQHTPSLKRKNHRY